MKGAKKAVISQQPSPLLPSYSSIANTLPIKIAHSFFPLFPTQITQSVITLEATDPTIEEQSSKYWWAGVLFSIASSMCSALGVNSQKIAHNRKAKGRKGRVISDIFWWGGMLGMILSSVFDIVSYFFAPMSILAPLAAGSLVFNIILARILLKEHITFVDVIAKGIIIVGAVVSLIFGNKLNITYTLDQLVKMFETTVFIVYACITGFLLLLFLLVLF